MLVLMPQSLANTREGNGTPGLDTRTVMRVVAGHAALNDSFSMPGANALAMGAMHPVGVNIIVALGADDIALVHVDELAGGGNKHVATLE